MAWQVQEAKQRFSEFLQQALNDGPQIVTRHGKQVAVLISAKDFEQLSGHPTDFKDFLLSAPALDELDLIRDQNPAHVIEL